MLVHTLATPFVHCCYINTMKLVSLNIEGHRHEDLVLPFLKREEPDVVCLQEAPRSFQDKLQSLWYYTQFVATTIKNGSDERYTEGLIIAARSSFQTNNYFYRKPTKEVPVFDTYAKFGTSWRSLFMAGIKHEGEMFNIATTHFCWSPDGLSTPNQREGMDRLLAAIKKQPHHVFCGDFNIPRGHNKLYEDLVEYYKDNVPESYESSLDAKYHKKGSDPEKSYLFTSYMVDYVFTQPAYVAKNVRLEFGVSDHAAVVAEIVKSS